MTEPEMLDLVIVGVGPAAMTASIYASRYKLSNLAIGKNIGGELAYAHKVENYPGFISISGLELATKWKEHAESLGGRVVMKEVGKIEHLSNDPDEANYLVHVGEDEKYKARAIIVSTGSERRRLHVPGEKEYLGRGVSFCTTCDSPFFRNKTVALIGGSDAAVSGAIHTAEYANKIYILYRGNELRAEPIWIEEWKKLSEEGKGETIFNTNVLEIVGNGQKVTGLKLDIPYQNQTELPVDGIFIEIGGVPGTSLVQPLGVALDESGHVIVTEEMATNLPGLFAAGDMVDRSKIMKQAITAMAQGAKAAASVYKFLKKETAPQLRGV